MRKNKIFKRVLAFASTFIVLLSLCATIAFAQAPQIDYSSNYVTLITYSLYDNNVVFTTTATFDQTDDFTIISAPDFVFTEYYYNELYLTYGDSSILSLEYDTYYYSVYNSLRYARILDSSFIDTYLAQVQSFYGYNYLTRNQVNSMAELSIYNQFTYWETEKENAFNDGYSIGQYEGYYEGQDDGYNIGYVDGTTVGYTNALNDFDMFERGLFDIFNAPFIFVRNIVGFEIFGITISDVIIGVLLLCLGFVLIKFIGGAIPL